MQVVMLPRLMKPPACSGALGVSSSIPRAFPRPELGPRRELRSEVIRG
jgi:hypothetical protein